MVTVTIYVSCNALDLVIVSNFQITIRVKRPVIAGSCYVIGCSNANCDITELK